MPFKSLFRRKSHNDLNSSTSSLSSKDKKALLGLKNIQAQQNPEPIYDLSNCSSPSLPDDAFTFCKILGKTSLSIRNNCLTSLETGGSLEDLSSLEILDASHNKIEKLPSDIKFLVNLTTLNLSFNKLKYLPDSFALLKNLEEVYLTNNRFSKVPLPLCALPKLRVLSIDDNNIKCIPKEITSLQHSLQTFSMDIDKVEFPSQDIVEGGLEKIMKYFCDLEGIEYTGPGVVVHDSPDSKCVQKSKPPPADDIMLEYMKKKDRQLKAQISQEEKLRALEKEQLENVLHNSSKSKDELLQELTSSPFESSDYEEKKREKIIDQMKMEQKFRNEQDEQIDLYLNNTSNKEALLMNMSAMEDDIQNEVEAIVAAREEEKSKLLNDLSKAERDTDIALKEIISLQQSPKSHEFVNLIQEQDEKMQQILSGIVEQTMELRRTDILKSMQNALLEDAVIEAQKEKIENKQNSWVASLIREGQIEETHIQNLMNNRVSNQESFVESLLQEEEYMAEAFKLLLLKMDLQRNNVMRQIAIVEYKLTQLSTLEVRKHHCGVQYGSTTMLNQRKTLVEILKSLLKAKEKRDVELGDWVSQLSKQNADETPEDFWLLQYQRLMMIKPSKIAEAEAELDPKVYEVLSMASALDLVPLFARHGITFSSLLDMNEEEFAPLDIGSATYESIQRALHSYLLKSKIGSHESAEDEMYTPSAPTLDEETEAASLEAPVDEKASAPPLELRFMETECVVCLNSDCRVLFMPCGHVCVCAACCPTLTKCPLCRCNITDKCFINAQ